MESKHGDNILSVKALVQKTVMTTSRHMPLQQVEHWTIVRKPIRDNPKIFTKSEKMFLKSEKNISDRNVFGNHR